MKRIQNPIENITVWARENLLKPFLLVDSKTSTISAIITNLNEANEYASKKKMAVYSEDMFKIGFWIDEGDLAHTQAFYKFAMESGVRRDYWDWAEKINKALEPYEANLIVITNWNIDHYDYEVTQFVSFKDNMGLTMFLLKYRGGIQ